MAEAHSLTAAFLADHPQEAARVVETLPVAEAAAFFAEIPARIGAPALTAMLTTAAARILTALDDAQVLVQKFAGDAGLDHAVQILGMNLEDPVHVAEIDRDASTRRIDMPFQRGAGAERDHRHLVPRTDAHGFLHIRGVLREHDRIRRLILDPGRGVAVLLAHGVRGHEAVAEALRKIGDR